MGFSEIYLLYPYIAGDLFWEFCLNSKQNVVEPTKILKETRCAHTPFTNWILSRCFYQKNYWSNNQPPPVRKQFRSSCSLSIFIWLLSITHHYRLHASMHCYSFDSNWTIVRVYLVFHVCSIAPFFLELNTLAQIQKIQFRMIDFSHRHRTTQTFTFQTTFIVDIVRIQFLNVAVDGTCTRNRNFLIAENSVHFLWLGKPFIIMMKIIVIHSGKYQL